MTGGRALLLLAVLGGVGCRPLGEGAVLRAPPLALRWKTLRAEQKVQIDVTLADGGHDRRTMRAVLAVERPGRFRLRALGPAGITLFDLLYVEGRVTVLEAIARGSGALGGVVASMAGDLAAAYDLAPRPPGRTVRHEGERVVVEEPERIVRESGGRIDVENRAHHYRVTVESAGTELDAPLDPKLFAD